MGRPRIVVIEDEPDIAELLEFHLEQEGFRVVTADGGEEGLRIVRQDPPALVLLDLRLPDIDGLDVCRALKEDPRTRQVRLIMLTARHEERDVVLGLGLGADDYVGKPFSPAALAARIRAVLRRGPLCEDGDAPERIVRDGVTIDAARCTVEVAGQPQKVTATQFRLLHFLASHPGRAFSREQLIARVIGETAMVVDRNIDVHVRSLRRILGTHRDLLETLRGIGYRFRDLEA